MRSSELMKMAEDGEIKSGQIVRDNSGYEFVFDGNMFIFIGEKEEDWEYGLCVDDNWKITNQYFDMG
jgi:hypothetical protein